MKSSIRIFSLIIVLLLAFSLCFSGTMAEEGEEELSLSVSAAEFAPGESLSIFCTLPHSGTMRLVVYNESGEECAVLADTAVAEAGTLSFSWNGMVQEEVLTAGAYLISLTLDNNSAEIEVTLLQAQASASPAVQMTKGAATDGTDDLNKTITPAYESAYRPAHENCYWCTPMDITNEEAVWAMLTAPVTVLDMDQKQQAIVRAEPNKESDGVAMLTGESQAVHLLENLDNGWSLIEIYSSSFHDSSVKHWNAFTTGYIETSRLTSTTPNQTYGIVIDKLTQKLYLFKEGKLYSSLLVSTGLANEKQPYNETRSGEFLIVSRTGDFQSDAMICAKALRFNSGDLIHEVPHVLNADGSKNYKSTEYKLGTRASHGCIRVQRRKNADGINHAWLWDNIKVGTKLVIWEDYAGRQIEMPDESMSLYYNPDGGTYYHSEQNCSSVRDKYLPLTAFTYGELTEAPYNELEACPYCTPERSPSEIEEINELHLTTSPGVIPYDE